VLRQGFPHRLVSLSGCALQPEGKVLMGCYFDYGLTDRDVVGHVIDDPIHRLDQIIRMGVEMIPQL
jgi:hypothetical protein